MSFSRRKFQNCWFLLISLIWHASFIIDRWLRARKVYTKVGAFHKNRSYLHSNFVVQKLIQEITHFVYFFSCFIVKRLPNIKEVVFSYYTVLNFFFFQEIIEDLCSMTKEMLKAFYRHLRAKPKKIIMFRRGVSEGQFQQVPTFFSFTRN